MNAEEAAAERRKLSWTGVSLRVETLHHRYGRAFWIGHSIWALITGAAVLVLAHNRYGYLPWVILFLALTWGSTLFFSRIALPADSRAAQLAKGVVSYLTRIMYQETLFFLLPFYFFSTTFPSWNCAYVIGLAALAVFSCVDIPFDRMLRNNRPFALAFFGIVTFSALQLFFPLALALQINRATYLSALLSIVAAVPLAYPWRELKQGATVLRTVLAAAVALAAVRLLLPAIPPVPLRLFNVRFAAALDPRTIQAPFEYSDTIPRSVLAGGRLYAIASVFAPSRLPATVTMRFVRHGKVLRTSRAVNLIAHARGFRVWDTMRPGPEGFVPGAYTVEVWTAEGQLVGRSTIRVVEDAANVVGG
jgi:hypothetical protein